MCILRSNIVCLVQECDKMCLEHWQMYRTLEGKKIESGIHDETVVHLGTTRKTVACKFVMEQMNVGIVLDLNNINSYLEGD